MDVCETFKECSAHEGKFTSSMNSLGERHAAASLMVEVEPSHPIVCFFTLDELFSSYHLHLLNDFLDHTVH